jgi:hypothetical protein
MLYSGHTEADGMPRSHRSGRSAAVCMVNTGRLTKLGRSEDASDATTCEPPRHRFSSEQIHIGRVTVDRLAEFSIGFILANEEFAREAPAR